MAESFSLFVDPRLILYTDNIILAARISPETTGATIIPHSTQLSQYHNGSNWCQSKRKVSLPNSGPLKRGRDSNIEPLVLINIIVVVAIAKVIVVVLMGQFCGELWLRPLSQDLFSPRVLLVIISTLRLLSVFMVIISRGLEMIAKTRFEILYHDIKFYQAPLPIKFYILPNISKHKRYTLYHDWPAKQPTMQINHHAITPSAPTPAPPLDWLYKTLSCSAT